MPDTVRKTQLGRFHRQAGGRRPVLALLVLAGLLGPVPALAASDPLLHAASPSSSVSIRRDIETSVRARHTLLEDPELSRYNLFVTLRDGVAHVRGPIPSAAAGQRAVELLQKVRGVREVQSELVVSPEPPSDSFVIPLPQPEAMQSHSDASPLPSLAAPSFSSLPQPEGPGMRDSSEPQGVHLFLPSPPTGGERSEVRGRSRPGVIASNDAPGGQSFPHHGPALALPAARSSADWPPAAPDSSRPVQLLPPAALDGEPTPASDELRARIERLRQADERFHFLQADLRGDTLFVEGQNGPQVMAFARQLTTLPGIKHVVVKVRAPRE